MLGVDEAAASSEVWDALGEVCNMVIGNFKGKTGRAGEIVGPVGTDGDSRA